ncbi:ElaB/YqjD/DUF883 family membrane-anchored ribosome-binding protein [Arthrobacter sp. V1I9]|uniref:hypothetical protein n=1 Tax=Arthrobacter sp. V1I9 TaxID=3042275 RepID=UPI00278D9F73|nr:hypothetical protein [Arthrobacter sp. V1I9]MDQ0871051.1 ElaB/YqjD/DUF883 family membrane-anchored ribosome-binding protein [Arthrobacter sp. V1I9]
MTENQWTSVPGSAPVDPSPVTPDSPASSKSEAVKDEAAHVAGQAKEAAQGVAQTAKEEAANIASEAKSSAQDLLSQAKSGLSSQAGTQQQKAAEGIRAISSQLQSMADAPDQPGLASDLIRQAAQRSESIASWVENREPAAMLSELQSFARRKPGTFLLLAAGAGMLAGRLTRGLTAVATAPATDVDVPPRPVQPPATETVVIAGIGEPFYDEPTTPSTYTSPTTPAASPLGSPELVDEEPWSGNRSAEDPLGDPRLAADPFDDDPLARDRRAGGQSGGL